MAPALEDELQFLAQIDAAISAATRAGMIGHERASLSLEELEQLLRGLVAEFGRLLRRGRAYGTS